MANVAAIVGNGWQPLVGSLCHHCWLAVDDNCNGEQLTEKAAGNNWLAMVTIVANHWLVMVAATLGNRCNGCQPLVAS